MWPENIHTVFAELSLSRRFLLEIVCTLSPNNWSHPIRGSTEHLSSEQFNLWTLMHLPNVMFYMYHIHYYLHNAVREVTLRAFEGLCHAHNNTPFLPEPRLTPLTLTLDESWLLSPWIGLIATRIKHMTPLCLLEQMPQKHRVISVNDSSANELFDQVSVELWELRQLHLRHLHLVYSCVFIVEAEFSGWVMWCTTEEETVSILPFEQQSSVKEPTRQEIRVRTARFSLCIQRCLEGFFLQ